MIDHLSVWKYLIEFDLVKKTKFSLKKNPVSTQGGYGSMVMINDRDMLINNDPNYLSNSIIEQASLPSTLHPSDIEPASDDDYTTVDMPNHIQERNQSMRITDSYVLIH